MPDTLKNIKLNRGVWTNLYTESGVQIGHNVKVENLTQYPIKIHSGEFVPSGAEKDSDLGYFVRSLGYTVVVAGAGEKGLWAYSDVIDGLVNVTDTSLQDTIKNGGVPLDVTRKLRIEGHHANVSGGNVWNDIWEGGAITIPEPDQITGEQLQVRSSDVNDTIAGSGSQRVRIDYLAGNELLFEELDLNGTTPVLTVATDITDIIDFYCVQVGADGIADGNVDITEIGNVALIYNRIAAGGNKSMSTLRHLLSDSTFYITDLVLSGDTKGTEVILRSDSTDGGIVYPGVYLFNVPVTMTDAPAVIRFNPALQIPGSSRVKVSARAGAAGNTVSVFINGWVKI